MLVYGSMLLVTLLFSWLYDNEEKVSKIRFEKPYTICRNIVFVLTCLPSIIVSAIRFDVGTDYGWVYWVGYLGVVDHPENTTIAKSYKPICQFLNIFSESPIPFFVISSVLILFAVFWYIRQTSEKITLPVLLFFIAGLFFDSLNVIRQYMAIAVWLFSYPYMRERKLGAYLLISAMAIFIHPTAVVLLPFYVFYEIRLTRRGFVTAGAILATGALLTYRLLPFVLVHIPKYSRYVTWQPDPEVAGILFSTILTIAVLALYNRLPVKEHTNFLLWALLLYDETVLLSCFLPQMGRVMIYFELPLFVNLIPTILSVLPRTKQKVATGAVISFLLLTMFYMNYYLGHADVFPYYTVFDVTQMEDYLCDSDEVLQLFLQDSVTI